MSKEFKAWKNEIKSQLPELVIKFYTYKLNGNNIPYEKEKMLGNVIKDISDPMYSYISPLTLNPTSYGDKFALQILLEIQVEELFDYIKTI